MRISCSSFGMSAFQVAIMSLKRCTAWVISDRPSACLLSLNTEVSLWWLYPTSLVQLRFCYRWNDYFSFIFLLSQGCCQPGQQGALSSVPRSVVSRQQRQRLCLLFWQLRSFHRTRAFRPRRRWECTTSGHKRCSIKGYVPRVPIPHFVSDYFC